MDNLTITELKDRLNLRVICESDTSRIISGGYTGDLLSWVMGRAPADSVWITVMSNINVIAVASLADVACVILAEKIELDETVLTRAVEQGINIYSSDKTAFELCRLI